MTARGNHLVLASGKREALSCKKSGATRHGSSRLITPLLRCLFSISLSIQPSKSIRNQGRQNSMKQWVSAQELVGVAGLSKNDRVIRRIAGKKGWQSRPRQGQGGGREYHISPPPTGAQAGLALRRWATETEARKDAMRRTMDAQPSHIQHAWASVPLPPACNSASRALRA